MVPERLSILSAGHGLGLADADLMPELGHGCAGDADGCAYHRYACDPVGVELAAWVVDLSAPECACWVTPLGDCLGGGLLVITHGRFSLSGRIAPQAQHAVLAEFP